MREDRSLIYASSSSLVERLKVIINRNTPVPGIVEEPTTEIYEDNKEIKILVDMPGAALTTTHMQITGKVLRIYADGGKPI